MPQTDMLELPPTRNQVDLMNIDGTPDGYPLRILRAYRERTRERWITHGMDEDTIRIYGLMNVA